MKKIISTMLLVAMLLIPVGVSAKESDRHITLTIDGKNITVVWYEYKWVEVNGNKYLINAGKLIKGWRFDRDRTNDEYGDLIHPLSKPYWYYFDETGKMLTNVVVDGYTIGADGKSYTEVDHNDLTKGQQGQFAKTIVPITTTTTATIETATVATQTVYKNEWKLIDSKWYYFNEDGTKATGWIQVNGKWYYLNTDGSMVSNAVINGYTLDATGAWVS